MNLDEDSKGWRRKSLREGSRWPKTVLDMKSMYHAAIARETSMPCGESGVSFGRLGGMGEGILPLLSRDGWPGCAGTNARMCPRDSSCWGISSWPCAFCLPLIWARHRSCSRDCGSGPACCVMAAGIYRAVVLRVLLCFAVLPAVFGTLLRGLWE